MAGKKIVWVGLLAVLLFYDVNVVSAYEYAGFDKLVKDVGDFLGNATSGVADLGKEAVQSTAFSGSLSSSTQDESERLVTSTTLQPILDDVVITNSGVQGADISRLKTEYNADSVFNELTANTWMCERDCYSEFNLVNKEEVPYSSLRAEFFYDDHHFQNPSDNIVSSRILVWDESSNSWTTPPTIPNGKVRIRLEGVKARNEDTAWLPIIDYKDVRVMQSRWALWKKGAGVAQSQLVAGYHMDGNTNDFSGNGLNGINQGTGYNWSSAVFGNGFSTFYSNFTIADNDLLDPGTGNFTYSSWIKAPITAGYFSATQTQPYLVSKGVDGGAPANTWGMQFLPNYNDLAFNAANATAGVWAVAFSMNVPLNTTHGISGFHHIALTRAGANYTLYFDGVKNSSVTKPWVMSHSNTNVLIIGASGKVDSASMRYVNTTFDEFKIYNKALSGDEVRDDYEAGITQLNITSPVNGSTSSQANVTAVLGFGDQTIASNITYVNVTGSVHVFRTNAGVETNTSSMRLTKLDVAHYHVLDFSSYAVGSWNVSLTACGGNGLVTCASDTRVFTVGTTTTTTTTTTTLPSSSNITSTDGAIRILPANQQLILSSKGFSILSPGGTYKCCGPDDSNNWVCTSGVCS